MISGPSGEGVRDPDGFREILSPSGFFHLEVIMKKLVFSVLAILVLASGCVSDTQWNKTHESYAKYVEKVEQTFKPICFKGTNVTFTVSGATEIAVTVPLNKIDAPPVPYDPAKDVVDAVKTVAGYGAAAYLGGKAIDKIESVKTVKTTTAAATP